MKSAAFFLLFCVVGISLQIESNEEYESKKEECASINKRVFKVKSYLTCIK